VVDPGLAQRLAELSQRPEVLVVAGVLAREHRVHRVMPVVIPHRVEPVATGGAGADDPRVVELRLGDHERGSAELFAKRGDLRRQLLEDVGWRLVDDREPTSSSSWRRRSRSEEHTSELQSRGHLVCRLLLAKKTTIVASWR